MKKIILSIFLFIGIIKGYSQANINADCAQSIPLCTTPNFTFNATSGVGAVQDIPNPSNISNPSTNPASANAGCLLSGELKPQWLLITISNPGNLEFVFGAGNSANPQAGFYDWAMWPYSGSACNNIANNTLPPVRCNWNATSSGGTGIASPANIPPGGNPGNYEPPLAVNACQQFIICISNYSGVNTLVSFQTLGTSSLTCNPNCNPNYTICATSSATIVPVNFSNLTNPTYSLNPGALSNTTGSFVVSPLVTTTYTTYITGLNGLNAMQTITATSVVYVNPQPNAIPTTTQSTCTNSVNAFNLGLTFSPALPVPNYTVTWAPIPFSVVSPTQTSGSGGIAAGQYNATITAAGGCSTTVGFNINPPPSPISFNIIPGGSSFTVTCSQPTLVLTLNPSSNNYTWTNGVSAPQTGTVAYFTNLNMGTWSVTGVNAGGCTSTQTFVVSQNISVPSSTVTPIFQNITCPIGAPATFTGITTSTLTNVTHSWYSPFSPGAATNGGTVSIYNSSAPGTYTYCVTNNLNGCSVCKTVTITSSNGFPTYTVTSPQQFTIGCSTTSLATINISNVTTFPTPGGPVSYTILPPSFVGPTYTVGAVSIYTANVPGQYTVIVHDNTNNCETKIPISIIQNTFQPQLTASAMNPTLTCDVPKTKLLGTSGTPNVSFNWSFPGAPGNVPSDTLTVFTTTNTTNTVVATYTLSVTDNINKCISTQTLTIYQNTARPTALITGGNVISCITETLNLTNSSTSNIPAIFFPTLPVIGYIWSGPSPQQVQQVSSTYLAYTPAGPGNTYTLVAKDLNNGCTAIATKTIADNRIYPIVNTPTGPGSFILDCAAPGATIYPILSGTTTGYTYSWLAVPTTSFSSYTSSITIVNKPGIYRIFVTNPSNGCVSSGNVDVINGGINGDFLPSTVTGFAPLTVNFTNLSTSSSTTTGTSSITSVWSFGNGSSQITTSASISPTTIYTQPGTYSVTLYVSKGSCLDTVVKVIKVELPSKLEVPNVFTPNGDGSNDVFFLKVANLSEINALIFDRWGNKIFESTSSTGNIQWDGKNQAGKELPTGTYFYIIKATGKDGAGYEQKGNVSLFR
ncbi:MAG: gliding motility-associated C-terminal domain-containing protein [Bacteroidota bacterium]|nr:gliding motility-associated C-terminal domain-containing protein [Bacteroidota bacterium]MDP3143760.1 gliding motility-associated C-terminal domain-containing protein [Bacteroidota bacterium]